MPPQIGLYKASMNDNLLDYQSWEHLIVDFPINSIEVAHQRIYFLSESLKTYIIILLKICILLQLLKI